MTTRPAQPLFLERQTYRRRRLMDAAVVLPVLGLILFLFPMVWAGEGRGAATATGGLFIFGVWTLLILAAAILSRRLRQDPNSEASPPPKANAPD